MSHIIMFVAAIVYLVLAFVNADSEIDKTADLIIANIYIAGLFILTEINRKR